MPKNPEILENAIIPNPLSKLFIYINNNIGNRKVVFPSEKKNIHYTIHFGELSGEIDIHKTNEKSRKHKTILKVKKSDLEKLLSALEKSLPAMLLLFCLAKKITKSIMVKNDWKVQPLMMETDAEQSIVTLKKNKLKFADTINVNKICSLILSPNHIKRHQSNVFLIYNKNNKVMGCIIRGVVGLKSNQFYYISISKLNKLYFDILSLLKTLLLTIDLEDRKNINRIVNYLTRNNII